MSESGTEQSPTRPGFMSYVSQWSLIIYRPIIPVWLIDNRPIIPTILKVAIQHKGSICHCTTKAGRGFVVSGQ